MMQFTIQEAVKADVLRNSAMSIPKPIMGSKILNKDIEIDSCCYGNGSGNALFELWNKQHPLIHTWLVISSISICFLFALFFIFQL